MCVSNRRRRLCSLPNFENSNPVHTGPSGSTPTTCCDGKKKCKDRASERHRPNSRKKKNSVDLSQITATSLSVCPSPLGSLGLRYHVKTRERRGSSFSQLGLEPNHTGLTAQSLFFLESCRVKRSDTQTFSNFSNYFKRVLKLQKRSSSFSK